MVEGDKREKKEINIGGLNPYRGLGGFRPGWWVQPYEKLSGDERKRSNLSCLADKKNASRLRERSEFSNTSSLISWGGGGAQQPCDIQEQQGTKIIAMTGVLVD